VKGEYSCCIKRNIRSLCTKLLISSLKFSSRRRRPSLGRTTLNPRVLSFLLFSLGIASLLYNNFLLQVLIILPSSANVDPESNNWYHRISIFITTIGIRAKGWQRVICQRYEVLRQSFRSKSSMAKETWAYGKRRWRCCWCNRVFTRPCNVSQQNLHVCQIRIVRKWI